VEKEVLKRVQRNIWGGEEHEQKRHVYIPMITGKPMKGEGVLRRKVKKKGGKKEDVDWGWGGREKALRL